MKFVRPASGTQQAIVRQELDNYLAALPQKVYPTIDDAVNQTINVGSLIKSSQVQSQINNLLDNIRERAPKEMANFASLNPDLLKKVDQQQHQNLMQNPNKDEIGKALSVYFGNEAYIPINVKLRGQELKESRQFPERGKPVYEIQADMARNVIDAVDELPQYSGVVKRGIAIPEATDIAQTYIPGQTFSSKGIISSAYDTPDNFEHPSYGEYWAQHTAEKDFAVRGIPHQPVIFEINSKYGRLTPNDTESEIGFQHGNRFRVKKVDPDYMSEKDTIPMAKVILEDLGTPIDRAVEYQQQSSSIGSQPSGLIATANRLGQQAAVVNSVNSVPVVPQKKAKFVVDQNSGQVQSFINKGDGQYIPHKQYNMSDARKAYSIARDNGWAVEHEFVEG